MATPILSPAERAVWYGRDSDADQASIPEQERWARDAVRREGLDLVACFSDHGIPGSEIDLRPDLQRLVALLEREAASNRPVAIIVVWAPDRLSRADSFETGALLKRVRDTGVTRVLTSERWIDLYNATDRLVFNVHQEAQHAAFSPKMSRDVLRSMAAEARLGFWMGGPAPLGYRIVARKLVLAEPADVATARWVFHNYATRDVSLRGLAAELAERGIRTPRGRSWSTTTLSTMLRNRAYLGEIVWNAERKGKFSRLVGGQVVAQQQNDDSACRKRSRKLKHRPMNRNAPEDMICVPGAHDALIDEPTFRRVAARLAESKGDTSPNPENRWPLRRLAHCAACGQRCFYCQKVRGKGIRRTDFAHKVVCPLRRNANAAACPEGGRADADAVLRGVVGLLKARLGSPEALAAIRAEALAGARETAIALDARRAELQRAAQASQADLATLRAGLLRVADDLRPDAEQAYREARAAHEGKLVDLKQAEREVNEAAAAADPERLGKLLSLIGRLDELVDAADPGLLTTALQDMVARVDVSYLPCHRGRGRRPWKKPQPCPKLAVTLTEEFARLIAPAYRGGQEGIIFRSDAA